MRESIDLWGTFSVADHFRAHPFVTDVLLYDRLVIPVPSDEDDQADAPARWDARSLDRLVGIMGDLALKVPWTNRDFALGRQRHGEPRDAIVRAGQVSSDLAAIRAVDPDAPAMYVTRQILADYANEEADSALFRRLKALAKRPGVKIEAVAAYGSRADLIGDVRGGEAPASDDSDRPITPAALFDWTVHVPDGDEPLKLLENAVELAGRSDFREHRSHFYTWLREIEGLVDDAGIRDELRRRLADYERIMRGQRWHTRARRATQLVLLAPGLMALAEPISAALAGAALGAAAYYVSEHMPQPQADDGTRVAAMAHDIEERLGGRVRLGLEGG